MFEVGDGLDLEALAAAAPGPGLAAGLAGIDLLALNGHARVVVLRAWERLCSWAAAGLYEAMGLVARSPMCVPDAAAELTEHFTPRADPKPAADPAPTADPAPQAERATTARPAPPTPSPPRQRASVADVMRDLAAAPTGLTREQAGTPF